MTRAPRLEASPRWKGATYLLFGGFVAVALATFTDYGIGWDEQWHVTYGDHIIHWYTSGFRDRGAIDFWNLRNYGGFFDVVAQLATALSPLDVFATRHLASIAFALLALVATYRLAAYLAGGPTAFVAVLFLLLTPAFYGHAFMNPKDIPFAALFVTALYHLVAMITDFPRPPVRRVLKFGIAMGLAWAVRIGGIVLMGYFALAALLWLARDRSRPEIRAGLLPLARTAILAGGVAYVTMLPFWPAAQVEPVMRPLKALWKSSHSDFGSTRVFFQGELMPASALPRYALLEWQLRSLPEFYLVALLAFVTAHIARRWRAGARGGESARTSEYVVVAAAVLFPFVHAAIARPVMYDSGRQYLFAAPLIAILAAAALTSALRATRRRALRLGVVIAVVASIGMTLVDLVQLHPYQYVFVNRLLAGGLSTAARSFETDYWGLSYKEGAEWIAAHYPPRAGGQPLKVASCSFPVSTTHFLPSDRYQFVGRPPQALEAAAELFLATPRWRCDERISGRVVHIVERQGTPLLYIKEVVHAP